MQNSYLDPEKDANAITEIKALIEKYPEIFNASIAYQEDEASTVKKCCKDITYWMIIKWTLYVIFLILIIIFIILAFKNPTAECNTDADCYQATCLNNVCQCNPGFRFCRCNPQSDPTFCTNVYTLIAEIFLLCLVFIFVAGQCFPYEIYLNRLQKIEYRTLGHTD
jgi:uncharacterized integral membrane protein